MIRYNRVICVAMLLLGCVIASMTFATDCGVIGTVYPVVEKDLLDVIEQHAQDMQTHGQWQSLIESINKTAQQNFDRPAPVAAITRATVSRTRTFDPSMVVGSDFRDTTGNIVVPQGHVINPLDNHPLKDALIFFDGDDTAQVTLVDKLHAHYAPQDKLILIRGSVGQLMQHFHQRVYFDQQGILSKRFGLAHVPAVITEEGSHLLIEEVQP